MTTQQTIAVGFDHHGYKTKQQLIDHLAELGFAVADCGTNSPDSCDAADHAVAVVKQVLAGQAAFGVLACYSGQAMAMAANRFKGIRAAICDTQEHAQLAREHNDANVLCLRSGFSSLDDAKAIIKTFTKTEAAQVERYIRRNNKLDDLGA